jgi:dTDP-4-dehydrorhamnose 3,5-epimerase
VDIALTQTFLDGVLLLKPPIHRDERGAFYESWHEQKFADAGVQATFRQENHSRSGKGVVRGLHFQDTRAPLVKLVRCTRGRVFDVVVDLRVGAPTFGRWFGVELSAENRLQILVPVGFAHGLQALDDGAEVQYRQSGFYAPESEGTIAWNDADIGIAWPLECSAVSHKDANGLALAEYLAAPAFRFTGSHLVAGTSSADGALLPR